MADLGRVAVLGLGGHGVSVEVVGGRFYGGGMFKFLRSAKLDREITQLFDEHQKVRDDASAIRDYLLQVLADNQAGVEKFSDEALTRAAELIEQVGPGAFYWMTDIAAQMVVLSEATLRGFSTNVSVELGSGATAAEIVKMVVRVP